jgi:diaminopimelate decarboxylase
LEAERLVSVAHALGTPAPIALRVNPAAEAQGGAMRMGGKPAPFGVDEEQLDELADWIAGQPELQLQGLHLYAGTQILDVDVLIRQYRKAVELAVRLARRTARPLATLDFGGGLGIPYFPGDSELDTTRLKRELVGLMAEIDGEPRLGSAKLVIEPGRYLVGEAGVYVTRVTDVKTSRGKRFLIVDGGMHHHLAASGNLGQVIKRNFPIALITRLDKESDGVADLTGPLCTPLDTIGRDVTLPAADVGDLVGVFQSGAYGLTASPVHFLGHPSPAEVLVLPGGECRLVRPRGELTGEVDDAGAAAASRERSWPKPAARAETD